MPATLDPEQQILVALAAGDHAVTTNIYRKNFPVVRGWIIKNGGTEADSADIFQEALMVLFGKSQEADFRLTCSIGTYLFAVSKHYWYKRIQKNGRNPAVLVEDDGLLENLAGMADDDIKLHHEREAHFKQLDAALEKLGEPCSSLLRAYYHEDKNMQEISTAFGYTNAENAKNQKYKCLTRLKKIFFSTEGTKSLVYDGQ
jgi:RNA polymerase sigma factor (sigma-70 family)